MENTKRRNLNRGYLKLDVWQRGMDLFEMAYRLAATVLQFKLRSQRADAAQSVSADLAEGYGRRRLPEYVQYLYIAKGSFAEAFTRTCGAWRIQLIEDAEFEPFDRLQYEVENQLLHLISAIEAKRGITEWQDSSPQ